MSMSAFCSMWTLRRLWNSPLSDLFLILRGRCSPSCFGGHSSASTPAMLADITNMSVSSKRKLEEDNDNVNQTLDHHIAASTTTTTSSSSSSSAHRGDSSRGGVSNNENRVLSGKGPSFSNKRVATEASKTVGVYTESDAHKVENRLKQISFGKNTTGYDNYIKLVPVSKRIRNFYECPRTPDPYEKTSKRAFDGSVKSWRRMLHEWDDLEKATKKAASILSSSSSSSSSGAVDGSSSYMISSNSAAMMSSSDALFSLGGGSGGECSFDALVEERRDQLKYVNPRHRVGAAKHSAGSKMAVDACEDVIVSSAPAAEGVAAMGSVSATAVDEGGVTLDYYSDEDVL